MIFGKITYTVLVGFLLATLFVTKVYAENSSADSDKIKQILLNTKFSELDINIDQSSADVGRNVEAVQYKIGFKDGYQKAVADFKNSFNQGALAPADSLANLNNGVAQQDSAEKTKAALLAKSFHDSANAGEWDAAVQAATKIVEMNPNDPTAFINRSWANAEKGDFEQAISDASKAVDLNPENPVAYNNRAYAHELAGSLTLAKKDYKAACDLNYQSACDAVATFERALNGNTMSEVKELLNRIYEKFKTQDWQAVEQMSTRAISLDPGNAMAYVNRAGARAELGLLSTALEDCNRAIQLNPGLGLAHNNCGYTYELLGRARQAELEYQQACNLGVKQSCKDYHRIAK